VLSVVTHTLPAQQPEHDWALQTQLPPEHVTPLSHVGPLPHWQVPPEPQAFARSGSQATQAPPAVPHVLRLAELHDGPEQQPSGQVVELQPEQTPLLHPPPSGHAWHAPPALPHCDPVGLATQLVPAQQPAQDWGSHPQ
jgi:hypothetical protein